MRCDKKLEMYVLLYINSRTIKLVFRRYGYFENNVDHGKDTLREREKYNFIYLS